MSLPCSDAALRLPPEWYLDAVLAIDMQLRAQLQEIGAVDIILVHDGYEFTVPKGREDQAHEIVGRAIEQRRRLDRRLRDSLAWSEATLAVHPDTPEMAAERALWDEAEKKMENCPNKAAHGTPALAEDGCDDCGHGAK